MKQMKAQEHFKTAHDFHNAASKEHAGLAEECDGQGYEKMAECHKNLSKLHADHAEHFRAMAGAAADKAVLDELNKGRNELPPSRVSGVTPTPPGITAVPRAGQKPIEKTVDPQFEHLIKVADEE
jgi:hypothetical protein